MELVIDGCPDGLEVKSGSTMIMTLRNQERNPYLRCAFSPSHCCTSSPCRCCYFYYSNFCAFSPLRSSASSLSTAGLQVKTMSLYNWSMSGQIYDHQHQQGPVFPSIAYQNSFGSAETSDFGLPDMGSHNAVSSILQVSPLLGQPEGECTNAIAGQREDGTLQQRSSLGLRSRQHSEIVFIGRLGMELDKQHDRLSAPAAFTNSVGSRSPTIRGVSGLLASQYHGLNERTFRTQSSSRGLGRFDQSSEILNGVGVVPGRPNLHQFHLPSACNALSLHCAPRAPPCPGSALASNSGLGGGSAPGAAENKSSPPVLVGLYSSPFSGSAAAQSPSTIRCRTSELMESCYISPGGRLQSSTAYRAAAPHMTSRDQEQHQLMGSPPVMDMKLTKDHHGGNKGGSIVRPSSSPVAATSLSPEFGSAYGGGTDGGHLASGKRKLKHMSSDPAASESRRQRLYMTEMYQTLRSMVPSTPSLRYRASIVDNVINYVKGLQGKVRELETLVRDKKCSEASRTRYRREAMAAGHDSSADAHNNLDEGDRVERVINEAAEGGGGGGEGGGSSASDEDRSDAKDGSPLRTKVHCLDLRNLSSDNSQLRSSWMQKSSSCSHTDVDVRMAGDEVTISITRRRTERGRQLLTQVISTLQEMPLDLQHASGAKFGEYDVYFFNAKILNGSSSLVYHAITEFLKEINHD